MSKKAQKTAASATTTKSVEKQSVKNSSISAKNAAQLEKAYKAFEPIFTAMHDVAVELAANGQDAYIVTLKNVKQRVVSMAENLDKRLEAFASSATKRELKQKKLADRIAKLQADLAKLQ